MAAQLELFSSAGETPAVAPAAQGADHAELAGGLPDGLYLGTSSWSFPGWRDLLYASGCDVRTLARHGLQAYAQHPLFRAVGLDRTFHAPLTAEGYRTYVDQVPAEFRFVVKAPAACTTPRWHATSGRPHGPNRDYLDADYAVTRFLEPCLEGLGTHLGALVFQFPPQGGAVTRAPRAFASRLLAFLEALPIGPLYCVELRDAALLNEDYVAALSAAGVTHCISVHPRLPDVSEQAAVADAALQRALVVRWNLHGGFNYEQARARYRPFDRLLDPDPDTRTAIVDAAMRRLREDRPAFITVNNKAEGSAPLSVIELAREFASNRDGDSRAAAE